MKLDSSFRVGCRECPALSWRKALGLVLLLAGMLVVGPKTVMAGNHNTVPDKRTRTETSPRLEDLSLPDLQTLPPFDLQLLINPLSGRKIIRFSNSVWNSGEGPLELHGSYYQDHNRVVVVQFVYGLEGEVAKHRVGELEYHSKHGHWHWGNFSIYEIWSVARNGTLMEMQATSGKVGYCMIDISRIDEKWIRKSSLDLFQIADKRQYWECDWKLQGISVGWVDTYDLDTPGQEMDVTSLPEGIYALRSIVDPDGLLLEANSKNNMSMVYFSLERNRLKIIGEYLTNSEPLYPPK